VAHACSREPERWAGTACEGGTRRGGGGGGVAWCCRQRAWRTVSRCQVPQHCVVVVPARPVEAILRPTHLGCHLHGQGLTAEADPGTRPQRAEQPALLPGRPGRRPWPRCQSSSELCPPAGRG
jgi:hypothetical protein